MSSHGSHPTCRAYRRTSPSTRCASSRAQKPAKQRLRRIDDKRRRAIGEEIAKLLAARFIKELFHSDWLANPILVKKKTEKWRMCIDYTGLNKACPKDHFPLPRIDQIVDSTLGCKIISFLDAYSGYH